MLIVHEVMGRHCGWLTAYTAKVYQDGLSRRSFARVFLSMKTAKAFMLSTFQKCTSTLKREGERLKALMDQNDCVNVFLG